MAKILRVLNKNNLELCQVRAASIPTFSSNHNYFHNISSERTNRMLKTPRIPINLLQTRGCIAQAPQRKLTPTDFDKTCLVKAGIFPSKEEVPETVSDTQMRRARDKMRVRIGIWLTGLSFVGCGFMVIWGRRDRSKGMSVAKEYMDKMENLRQQGLQEEAERQALAKENGA